MSKSIKIYIVDDHDIVIDGLKSILNPFGYAFQAPGSAGTVSADTHPNAEKSPLRIIGIASSGEELLERISGLKELDLVVMDYYMKGMNGLETAVEVKKIRPDVKVILFSMEESGAIITEVFAHNIEGYVTKVEGRQRLLDAVMKVYKGERVFPNLKTIPEHKAPWLNKPVARQTDAILSKRETEVACLIVNGHTTQQIADKLNIAFNTVEVHRNNLYRKLEINRLADLVRYALENKLCL